MLRLPMAWYELKQMFSQIRGYRILGVKDLPLLLGYKYRGEKLSQLLKGM